MTDAIQKAREALKPFAALADIFDNDGGNRPKTGVIAQWADHRVGEREFTVEDLRAARDALSALDAEREVKATQGLADLSVAMAGDIIEAITGKPATPDQSAKVSLFIFNCATTGALPFEILAALVPPESRS